MQQSGAVIQKFEVNQAAVRAGHPTPAAGNVCSGIGPAKQPPVLSKGIKGGEAAAPGQQKLPLQGIAACRHPRDKHGLLSGASKAGCPETPCFRHQIYPGRWCTFIFLHMASEMDPDDHEHSAMGVHDAAGCITGCAAVGRMRNAPS